MVLQRPSHESQPPRGPIDSSVGELGNATHLFATYAFDIGMGAGQLGLGASVALTMLPALALLIVALTLYMRRQ